MITIYNINAHTLQEVYDQIARHLLTQGKQCLDMVGECNFRNDKGLACAIGSLIPEEEYDPSFEACDFRDLFYQQDFEIRYDLVELLEMLRVVHDAYNPDKWPYHLKVLAEKNRLSSEVVSRFT